MTDWAITLKFIHRSRTVAGELRAQLARRRQALSGQLGRRWQGLTPRERKQLRLMLAVLLGAAVWLLFARPALATLRYWNDELPRLRAQSIALEAILADGAGPRVAPNARQVPPARRVAASLDQAGLTGSYRLSGGKPELVITFAQPVPAGPLLVWLLNAPVSLGLPVRQVLLERSDATAEGRIKATITLATHSPSGRNGT